MKIGDEVRNKHTGTVSTIKDILSIEGADNPIYVLTGGGRHDYHSFIPHWEILPNKSLNLT